jgi:methylmalonyl-CoA mutase N-terminal domain/subunit
MIEHIYIQNLPCFDEAYAIPSDEAIRTSLRIQQIIAHEIGIPDVADPLGGSYYVESLTRSFEKQIAEEMKDMDSAGGILRAVEEGTIQTKLANQAYNVQEQVDSGELVRVGVNKFQTAEDDRDLDVFELDPETRSRQIDRLRKVKAERDPVGVENALAALSEAAQGGMNLMPFLLDAVRAYATVGEIVSQLKGVYGEAELPNIL